jgi:hypothetical protein
MDYFNRRLDLLLAPCPPLAPPKDYPSPMLLTPFTLRKQVFIVVAQPTQATSVYMLLVYALVAYGPVAVDSLYT